MELGGQKSKVRCHNEVLRGETTGLGLGLGWNRLITAPRLGCGAEASLEVVLGQSLSALGDAGFRHKGDPGAACPAGSQHRHLQAWCADPEDPH